MDDAEQLQEIAMAALHDPQQMPPAHPGGFIRREIVAAHDLTVTRAAEILGVTRAALSALLNERAHLSPEMALRLEMAFGLPMDRLMRMQTSHDIAMTRRRAGEIRIQPYQPAPRP